MLCSSSWPRGCLRCSYWHRVDIATWLNVFCVCGSVFVNYFVVFKISYRRWSQGRGIVLPPTLGVPYKFGCVCMGQGTLGNFNWAATFCGGF